MTGLSGDEAEHFVSAVEWNVAGSSEMSWLVHNAERVLPGVLNWTLWMEELEGVVLEQMTETQSVIQVFGHSVLSLGVTCDEKIPALWERS
jgi:hypothetical protein